MSSRESSDIEDLPKRSLENKHPTCVTFVCRTNRTADIFWLNFNGEKIKYATLTTGQSIQFNTWQTHPWVFRDTETFDVLVANNTDEIYYPIPCSQMQPVTIDTPLWSLKEICIQNVRKLKQDADIARLEIPRDLIRDTLAREDRAHGMIHFYNPNV